MVAWRVVNSAIPVAWSAWLTKGIRDEPESGGGHCRQDKALPPGYFYPRMSSRLGAFKLLEMDGSHELMFTRPEELADKIVEASFG